MPPINPPKSALGATKEIIKDIVGPMGLIVAAADSFVKHTSGAASNAEKLRAALTASAGAEQLRKQFEAIGLSSDQARQKVDQLAKASANSAFSFESLGQASKNLQAIGGSALNTSANLKKIMDVAAATGAPVDNVATSLGAMYESLRKGDGGAASLASSLASMGAITGDTASKLQQLAQQGAPAADSLRLLEGDLRKAKGASEELGGTLSGLQAKLQNLQQANNAKIGNQFIEGEKAGLRAALGFEKLRGAIDEASSAPFATIIGFLKSIEEAIANFVSRAGVINAVKGIFAALSSVSVAVFTVMIGSLLQLGAGVIGFASKAGVFSNAMTLMTRAGGTWLGWINTAFGKITLITAAITVLAEKLLEAKSASDAIGDSQQKLSKGFSTTAGSIESTIRAVQTPDDKQQAISTIKSAIATNDEELAQAKKDKATTSKDNNSGYGSDEVIAADGLKKDENGLVIPGTFDIAARTRYDKAREAAYRAKSLETNGDYLKGRLRYASNISNDSLAANKEQDAELRQEPITQESIRKEAFDRLTQSTNGKAAVEAANSERMRTQANLANASKASALHGVENTALFDAQDKVSGADSGAELSKGFEALNALNPETESGKLSKQIAQRGSVATLNAANQKGLFSEDADVKKKALERQAVLNKQITEVGGPAAITGAAIDDLTRKRDEQKRKESLQPAQQKDAQAEAQQTAARALAAAQDNQLQKEKEKVQLENQLAGLGNSGKDAAVRATAEFGQQASQLSKAAAAAKELESATSAYASARGTEGEDAAKKKMEAATVAAAGAGTNGRSSAEIESALNIEKQILQTKLEEAATAERLAQAETASAQRRLNAELQIAQLRAQGPNAGKSVGESRNDSLVKESNFQKEAVKAAEARDAAKAQAVLSPTAANIAAQKAAQAAADKYGVSANTRTEDVKNKSREADTMAGDSLRSTKDFSEKTADEARVRQLRVMQEYAPNNKARRQAKDEADKIEDKRAVIEKTKEFGEQGIDQKSAKGLAENDVRRERLVKNLQEEGTAPASQMARMGGSSGFAGVVTNTEDVQKKIAELNQKQHDILAKMQEKNDQIFPIIMNLLKENQ